MKRIGLIALTLLAAGSPRALPAEFPSKITYLFYVQGRIAGRSDVTVTLEKGVYVFSSSEDVGLSDYSQKLACRTEVDGRTLRARSFHYEGVRQGESVSGTVRVEADSAKGEFEAKGTPYTSGIAWVDPTFLFENYVPEHLIFIGRHVAASKKLKTRFSVVFPSNMVSITAVAVTESEVEIATSPSPTVCNKYGVAFENSAPFFLYVDPDRNIPVYMDFPSLQTEVFLKEAFGEHPAPRYKAPTSPESR
jgi:hypothetical protein